MDNQLNGKYTFIFTPRKKRTQIQQSTAGGSSPTNTEQNIFLQEILPTSQNQLAILCEVLFKDGEIKIKEKTIVQEKIRNTSIFEQQYMELQNKKRLLAISIADCQYKKAEYQRQLNILKQRHITQLLKQRKQYSKDQNKINKPIQQFQQETKVNLPQNNLIKVQKQKNNFNLSQKSNAKTFQSLKTINKDLKSSNNQRYYKSNNHKNQNNSHSSLLKPTFIKSIRGDVQNLKQLDELLKEKQEQQRIKKEQQKIVSSLIQMEEDRLYKQIKTLSIKQKQGFN